MKQHVKSMAKHGAIYTIGNMLTKAIGILLIPIYTKYLQTAEYGIISLLAPFITFIYIFFDFGSRTSVMRFFFDYPDGSKEQKEVLGSILGFVIVFALVLLGMLYASAPFLAETFLDNVPYYPFVIFVISIAFFQVFYELKMAIYKARNQSLKYVFFTMLRFLAIVVLTILLIVKYNKGAEGKFFAEFLVNALFGVLCFVLLFKDVKLSFRFAIIKSYLQYATSLLPHAIFGAVSAIVGKYFINKYVGLEETAIFNIAFLIGSIMSIIAMSLNQIWSPLFYRIASNDEEEAKSIFARLTTYFIGVVLLVGMGLIFFSKEIVLILAGEQYLSSLSVVPFIVGSYMFSGFYFSIAVKIFYKKQAIRKLPWITLAGVSVNIILSSLLVPLIKMQGAALAMVSANAVVFCISYFFAQKSFYIKYEYVRLLKLLLAFIIVALAFGLIVYLPLSLTYETPIKFLLILVFVFLLKLMKVLKKEEVLFVKRILKMKK
jgi:O-antigen/teichoic acid export membrane protein